MSSPRDQATPAPDLVVVDIGNSAVKWTVERATARTIGSPAARPVDSPDNSPNARPRRLSIEQRDWPSQLLADVDRRSAGRPTRFRVASVNTAALEKLSTELAVLGRGDQLRVIRGPDCPMTTVLANPERLGIDRLLAAWRASRLRPERWVIVVDAGSAITVDCIDPAGIFRGGAILPGIALQLRALGRGTDALPTLDHSAHDEPVTPRCTLPGTDTVAAIQSGVWLGTAAAIEGLVRQTLRRVSEHPEPAVPDAEVFLTGGDAARLSPLIDLPHHVRDNLVIEALLADELAT